MTVHHHPPPATRRGISLLEVLISIGILAVGLIAVLSLVPVGRSYLAKAVVDDQAAVAIPAAYETLTTANLFTATSLAGTYGSPIRVAALDPMMATRLDQVILRENITGDSPLTRARQNLALFNQTDQAGSLIPFSIPRLSWTALATAPPLQRVALADRLCRLHDDLEVDPNVADARGSGKRDEFAPPRPVYATDPSSGKALARQSVGRMSWLFLLQPQGPGTFAANWVPGGVFDVSLVIFRDRPFRTLDGTAPAVTGEYVFKDAAWDPFQGLLRIVVPQPLDVNDEDVYLEDEDLRFIFKAGGWILLAPIAAPTVPPADNRQKLVWVRAQTVEIGRSASGGVVTVLPEAEPPADVLGVAAGTAPVPLVALVYEGVVAVATKQITVQGP